MSRGQYSTVEWWCGARSRRMGEAGFVMDRELAEQRTEFVRACSSVLLTSRMFYRLPDMAPSCFVYVIMTYASGTEGLVPDPARLTDLQPS